MALRRFEYCVVVFALRHPARSLSVPTEQMEYGVWFMRLSLPFMHLSDKLTVSTVLVPWDGKLRLSKTRSAGSISKDAWKAGSLFIRPAAQLKQTFVSDQSMEPRGHERHLQARANQSLRASPYAKILHKTYPWELHRSPPCHQSIAK